MTPIIHTLVVIFSVSLSPGYELISWPMPSQSSCLAGLELAYQTWGNLIDGFCYAE